MVWSTSLLKWYESNKRDLPWRMTKDPYAIWISEIMLQQTRVETVKAYYLRFLSRFPDAASLAAAPEDEVLKLWEGLGYYSRARNLQKAAKQMVLQYSGTLPGTYRELLALPGIGAYTAGAVASIAYGEAIPAVDGNVKRVASRLFGIRENVDRPDIISDIHERLQKAIPANKASDFTQAMMELGATLCTPRTPKCHRCPLAQRCDACLEGDQENLPVHEKKMPPLELDMAVCIMTYREKVILFRRNERLLHGLYVFALLEKESEPERAQEQLVEDGWPALYRKSLGEAKHVFTHRVWNMKIYHFELTDQPTEERLKTRQAFLVNSSELESLPMPTAMKTARRMALAVVQDQCT